MSVTLAIPTLASQTVLEIQTLQMRANALVLLNVFQASVTLIQTPVCHLALFLSKQVRILLDATAQVPPSALLTIVTLEAPTPAFQIVPAT
jgi:hypothetical protein